MQNAIPQGDPANIKVIGREQGFKGLAVHYTTVFDTGIQQECPALETAWTPDPGQLAKLNAGGNVGVRLLATQHPPIAVYVGDPPEGATMPPMTYNADMLAKCVKAAVTHAHLTTKRGPEAQAGVVLAVFKALGMVEANG